MFSKLVGIVVLFASTVAMADSRVLDSTRLSDCGGRMELREARNGDLSIQLRNVDTYRCYRLQVSDVTSGRIIKAYSVEGSNYTLSNDMLRSLSDDCRIQVNIGGSFWSNDRIIVAVPYCLSSRGVYYGGRSSGRVSYELSNKGNCKKMIDGQFSGELVERYKCY